MKNNNKQKAIWITCTGEAHSNPYIDNCGVCMPYWGNFPTCPNDGTKLRQRTGYCPTCKKYYNLERN